MKVAQRVGLLLLVLAIAACASDTQILRTPQEKSAFFMSYYVAQKKDYEKRVAWARPGAVGYKTEYRILKAKKRFLEEAKEPVKLYDTYVTEGKIPTAAMERAVFEAINRLEEELNK